MRQKQGWRATGAQKMVSLSPQQAAGPPEQGAS